MDKILQSKWQLFICAFKKEKCISYAVHNCGLMLMEIIVTLYSEGSFINDV